MTKKKEREKEIENCYPHFESILVSDISKSTCMQKSFRGLSCLSIVPFPNCPNKTVSNKKQQNMFKPIFTSGINEKKKRQKIKRARTKLFHIFASPNNAM